MAVYIAEKTIAVGLLDVPDYKGLGKWKWIARRGFNYFWSENELDATLAPETYSNGNAVNVEGCINEIYDGVPKMEADNG